MASSVTLLLLASVVVATNLAKPCLECYQCSSVQEVSHFCDTLNWHSLPTKDRDQFIFGCPEDKSDYCIKKELFGLGIRQIERGCSNGTDSAGKLVRPGCFQNYFDRIMQEVCFCTTSLCNSGGLCRFKYLISAVVIFVMRQNLEYFQRI